MCLFTVHVEGVWVDITRCEDVQSSKKHMTLVKMFGVWKLTTIRCAAACLSYSTLLEGQLNWHRALWQREINSQLTVIMPVIKGVDIAIAPSRAYLLHCSKAFALERVTISDVRSFWRSFNRFRIAALDGYSQKRRKQSDHRQVALVAVA